MPYAQGIGFAIPAHTADWVCAVLVQRGFIDRPIFGIVARAEPLPTTLAREHGQSRAIRVIGVHSDAPAARAGVREGDLILALDGQRIGTVDDLQRIAVLSAKTSFTMKILRASQPRVLDVRPQRSRSTIVS